LRHTVVARIIHEAEVNAMRTTGSIQLFLTVMIALLMSACSHSGKEKVPAFSEDRIDKIISDMSLDEKALLVVGTGMDLSEHLRDAFSSGENPLTVDLKKADPGYAAMVERIRKYVPGAAGRTAEIPRLGITSMVVADGPAGLRIDPKRKDDPRTYYATAFPIATLLASSWDTDLLFRVGQAMGQEVLEYGVDAILGPALNLHRNPLCGRNFEYYSEDPLITGKMAAAVVRGLQSQGVGVSIKHFAANNQETNRQSVNTIVSERALRELYLKGFRIAVQEGEPWTVMSSYNKINGRYASESYDLLTKILRDDWGFKGYVMTDWLAGTDRVAQMKAGNDLIMPGNPSQSKEIAEAVRKGKLDEKVLDQNVKRILAVVAKTPRHKSYRYSDTPDLKAHAEIARIAGTEGMVLLKNKNNALPFAANIKTIAVFGNTSYKSITGGTGSGKVNEAYSISLIDGLKNGGYSIDESLEAVYSRYIKEGAAKQPKSENPLVPPPPTPEMKVTTGTAADAAAKTDVALITIGRNSGEGGDRKAEAGDFYLTDTEKSLIQNVSKEFRAKGKKVIVVINTGGVIETASWRGSPDAILLAWQPGQETGNAVVDVLSGKVNPSGKLTDTFPISYRDIPSAKNFPGVELPKTAEDLKREAASPSFMKIVPAEVVYQEDIYVGYRYFNTFNVPVAYEFGFGLSYTQFRYGKMEISSNRYADPLTVSVNVENTGKIAGREIVQIYISAPAGKLNKPAVELIAFGKTKLLKPTESQTMSFVIHGMDFASFDEATSSWIAEPGRYIVQAGASSRDIRQSVAFDLDKGLIIRKVNKALTPERQINRLARASRPE
jgi:beta-glucosidase